MDSPTLAGSTIGFILAIVFLTHSLIRYEDFLNDKKLGRGFMFGFVFAIIAYIVEQAGFFSFAVQDVERDSSLAFISIFGIAFLHTAMKGMALNHRSLWDGKDVNVPFYGAFYGFIFGAIYVTVIISKNLSSGEIDGIVEPILLFLLALGMVLFQGSTSIIMGWGIPRGKLTQYFLKVSLAHVFMNIFIFLGAVGLIPFAMTVLLIVVYGFFLYGFCYQVILPDSLSREQTAQLFPSGRPVARRLSGGLSGGLSRGLSASLSGGRSSPVKKDAKDPEKKTTIQSEDKEKQ